MYFKGGTWIVTYVDRGCRGGDGRETGSTGEGRVFFLPSPSSPCTGRYQPHRARQPPPTAPPPDPPTHLGSVASRRRDTCTCVPVCVRVRPCVRATDAVRRVVRGSASQPTLKLRRLLVRSGNLFRCLRIRRETVALTARKGARGPDKAGALRYSRAFSLVMRASASIVLLFVALRAIAAAVPVAKEEGVLKGGPEGVV